MSTNLMDRLHAVGQLNDQWSEEHLADGPGPSSGREVSLMAFSPPRSPLRKVMSAAAAAAVVVLGAAIALALVDRDDSLSVATPGATVALIPDPSVYEDATMLRVDESEPPREPTERVIVAPAEAPDDRARWVVVTVGEWRPVNGPGAEVSRGGIVAIHEVYDDGPEAFHYQVLAVPIAGGSESAGPYLLLSSTLKPDLDELFALAEELDPSRPLTGQHVSDWRFVASRQTSGEAQAIRQYVIESGPGDSIFSLQFSGVAEGAQWFVITSPVDAVETELAGRTVLLEDIEAHTPTTTATWIEAPDLLVQISVIDEAPSEERLARLEQVIAGLIPVDQEGWAEFESLAFFPEASTSRGDSDATTTAVSPTTALTQAEIERQEAEQRYFAELERQRAEERARARRAAEQGRGE